MTAAATCTCGAPFGPGARIRPLSSDCLACWSVATPAPADPRLTVLAGHLAANRTARR